MVKMIGLVKNEFIKTFKKVSTIILCVFIAIVGIGYSGIVKISEKINSSYYEEYAYDDYIDYDYEIKRLEELGYQGYKFDIEMYEYLKQQEITYSSWKYTACTEIFSYDYDENYKARYVFGENERNELKKLVEKNDWKAYCEGIIAQKKALGDDEEMYWEYQYRIDNNIPLPDSYEESNSWQNRMISNVAYAKEMIANGNEYDEETRFDQIEKVGLYQLDNNIELNVKDYVDGNFDTYNCWAVLGQSSSLIMIIGLFVMVIAGSIVANEYSQGTIKFLLINPVKRWKILISKYITCILTGYAFIVMFYVLTVISSGIVFGFSPMNAQHIEYVSGKVVATSGLWYIFKVYMTQSISVLVMSTLAFAISSLVRSSSLAIGISVFLMLTGNSIVYAMSDLKLDWARYLVFANTDLATIANGGSPFPNHSVGFAVGVIVVHMIVFLLTAWDGFTKREV